MQAVVLRFYMQQGCAEALAAEAMTQLCCSSPTRTQPRRCAAARLDNRWLSTNFSHLADSNLLASTLGARGCVKLSRTYECGLHRFVKRPNTFDHYCWQTSATSEQNPRHPWGAAQRDAQQ